MSYLWHLIIMWENMSQLSRLHCSLSTFKCQQLWSEICQGLVNSNFSLKVFFYCKIWSVVQHYYIMMCGYLWDFIWNMVYFRWHICTWSKKHSQMFSWANYLKQYFLSRSISPSSVCILFFSLLSLIWQYILCIYLF